MSSSDLDLTPPLSTLLRTHTLPAHKAVESSNGARILASGDPLLLSREEYVRYLARLWIVYRELELALAKHGPAHPLLSSIYDPSILDLSRTKMIEEDICFFLDPPSSLPSSSLSSNHAHEHASWHAHPILFSILHLHYDASSSISTYDPLEKPVKRYVDRIREISDSNSNDCVQIGLLLAHAYVRYMGDLSGGQFIRKRIAKAFDLEVGDNGVDGVKFYDFPFFNPNSQSEPEVDANANANAKRIKSHFRASLDVGFSSFVEDNDLSELEAEAYKLSLVNEANLAFELSGGLFDLIHAPDPSSSSSDTSISSKSDLSLVSSSSISNSLSAKSPKLEFNSRTIPKLSLSPIISHIYSSFAFNNNARICAVPACIIVAGFAVSVQVIRWMYQLVA